MSPITTSIEVDRSAEEVFAYATDPGRFSEWQKGVISGQMYSAGAPPGRGPLSHDAAHRPRRPTGDL